MRSFKRCSISSLFCVTFASLFLGSASQADEKTDPPEASSRMESITVEREQRINRLSDEDYTETPEPTSPEQAEVVLDQEWSTDKLRDVLSGKTDPPEGWPKNQMPVTTTRTVHQRDAEGNSFARPGLESSMIDSEVDLTPAQRHAICVRQFDTQIRSLKSQLNQGTQQDQKAKLLTQLKNALSARFRIDTVFQDVRVKEIERRAQKLRKELDARGVAEESWVQAMLTLAEMKSDGIDTMPDGFPQPTQNEFGRHRQGGFSQPNVNRQTQNMFQSMTPSIESQRYNDRSISQFDHFDDMRNQPPADRADHRADFGPNPRSQSLNSDRSLNPPRQPSVDARLPR